MAAEKVFAFGFGRGPNNEDLDAQLTECWDALKFPAYAGLRPRRYARIRDDGKKWFVYTLSWGKFTYESEISVETMLLARTPCDYLLAEVERVQDFLDGRA
jgi:hypothetical protein